MTSSIKWIALCLMFAVISVWLYTAIDSNWSQENHVRSDYKLSTFTLDAEFARNLHFKTGYPEQDIVQLVEFINDLDGLPALSDSQLIHFHKQLELFYQNT